MTKHENWEPESDRENVSEIARELRAKVAERVYAAPFQSPERAQAFLRSPRTHWRAHAVLKAEIFHGKPFSGTIVEVGAGTAWCSALLSKNEKVGKIYAVDYDPVSVDKIMPNCFRTLGADGNKITRVIGSYNALKIADGTVDCVFAMGALHHSENLQATFREISRVLKPGGMLVASEDCHPDSIPNWKQAQLDSEFIDAERVEKLYGSMAGQIRASDNSDHHYRLVDYMAAALHNDLEVFPYTFDDVHSIKFRDETEGDAYFRNRECYRGFQKVVLPPYFAIKSGNGQPIYDPLLLIARKPDFAIC